MRRRRRLNWSAEDHGGLVIHKAKRKHESVEIVPSSSGKGPYTVLYRSAKGKHKVIASTLREGKAAAEELRSMKRRKNPISVSKPTKMLIGVGAIGLGAGYLLGNMLAQKQQQAATPITSPPAQNPSGTQIYIEVKPGAQSTSYSSGTLFLQLPAGAQWISFGGDNSYAGLTQAIQLPSDPLGTYQFQYSDSNGNAQNCTLTVASVSAATAASAQTAAQTNTSLLKTAAIPTAGVALGLLLLFL